MAKKYGATVRKNHRPATVRNGLTTVEGEVLRQLHFSGIKGSRSEINYYDKLYLFVLFNKHSFLDILNNGILGAENNSS